jgi:hypothetical protein
MSLPSSHPDYEQPWDEYVEAPVAEAEQHPAPMDSYRRDRMIESLDHDRALREGDDSSERFGWERERIVYDRRGSYNELRRALRLLHRKWSDGYNQIVRVHFRGLAISLTSEDQLLLDAAEEWLARTMRGEIRVPPWLQEASAKIRQRSVAELAADGLSAGQIARMLRIPKQKVRKLIAVSDRPDSFLPGCEDEGAAPGEPERVRV